MTKRIIAALALALGLAAGTVAIAPSASADSSWGA
jgi:hypothetical protein